MKTYKIPKGYSSCSEAPSVVNATSASFTACFNTCRGRGTVRAITEGFQRRQNGLYIEWIYNDDLDLILIQAASYKYGTRSSAYFLDYVTICENFTVEIFPLGKQYEVTLGRKIVRLPRYEDFDRLFGFCLPPESEQPATEEISLTINAK